MGNCDVCGNITNWEEGTAYTADEFRTLVRLGFEPPSSVVMLGPAAVQGWKTGLVAASTTGWLLCPSCARRAARYMPRSAGAGPEGHVLYETMPTEQMLGTAPAVPPVPEKPPILVIRAQTKACPTCQAEIDASAAACPACQATFAVTFHGYCSTERAVVAAGEDGRCLTCGKEVLDRYVESQIIGVGMIAAGVSTEPLVESTSQPPAVEEALDPTLPACAACRRSFDWNEAYQAQDTPGSAPHNPPGNGVFRPRAYCPHCGVLVAEWHIDRIKDYDEWAWVGENAALNSGKDLPPNPLYAWGKGIPVALRPTIDENRLAVDKIKQQQGVQAQVEPETSPEAIALARQAEQLLNDGELEKASQLFEQAATTGMKYRDHAFCLGATGVYYLYKRGDVENAYRYCRRGIELDPAANWQANYVLSLIYSAAGETDKAEKELADAQRFAGTVWWEEDFDRGLKTNLNAWTEEHGKATLKAIVLAGAAAGGMAVSSEEAISSAASAGIKSSEAVSVPEGSKKCPLCGEEIKLEARVCRFCKARFEVVEKGYCANCHKLVQPAPDGRCPTCQGELLDRRMTSQLIEDAAPSSSPYASQPSAQSGAIQGQDWAVDAAVATAKPPAARSMSFWRLFFSPNGRINRSTFLLKGLLPLIGFIILVFLALGLVSGWETSDSGQPFSDALIPVFAIGMLLAVWSALMLLVKRLHDINHSGWNLLYVFIPFIGQFIYLIIWLMCIFRRGVDYSNRFDGRPVTAAFTPLPHPNTYSDNYRQSRARRWIAALAVIALIVLVGWYLVTNFTVGPTPKSQPTSLPAAVEIGLETEAPQPAADSAPIAAPQEVTSVLFSDQEVSFEYPPNWQIIDEDGVQTLLRGTLEGIEDWEYIGGVYTNKPDDCVDCAHITVTIIPLPAGFTGWSDEFYERIKQNAQSSMGERLQLHRQVEIGDYPGWETIYLGKSGRTKIWDKSFLPSGESVLVMVSASANPDQFDQFLPIFEQAYASLSLYGASE